VRNAKLRYHTKTVVCLQAEDFMNAGLSSQQVKTIIEKVVGTFSCSPSSENGNWEFEAPLDDEVTIKRLVDYINFILINEGESELASTKRTPATA
jgi:hypothetical protein